MYNNRQTIINHECCQSNVLPQVQMSMTSYSVHVCHYKLVHVYCLINPFLTFVIIVFFTERLIPGHRQSFPSYPGRLYSGDDYYLLSSGLVCVCVCVTGCGLGFISKKGGGGDKGILVGAPQTEWLSTNMVR